MAADRSAVNRSADDPHLVLRLDVHRNSHAAENVGEGLGAVALLVDEPVCASDDRSAVALGGERGERREKVGAVRGVEFEGAQGTVRGRHGVLVVDDRGPGPHECRADGRVGLLRKHGDVLHGDFARDGARHEQHGRGAPVPLDAEKSRAVALSALDVELLVVVMADFHAETCIEITAREIMKLKKELYTIIADHSHTDFEKVWADSDRDYWMTAEEAKEYGMVDEVLIKK